MIAVFTRFHQSLYIVQRSEVVDLSELLSQRVKLPLTGKELTGGADVNTSSFRQYGSGIHRDGCVSFALFRLTVAVDMLFHSATRWLHVHTFALKTAAEFSSTPLPQWSVRWYATSIVFVEPTIGILLLLGLRTRLALIAASLLMTSLVFGTALRGDFTVLSEQLMYSLIFFFLLLYRDPYNGFSFDNLIAGRLGAHG